MEKPKITVLYYRENLVQSVVADIITFGTLMGLFFANYYYLNNQAWTGVILTIMALMYIGGFRKANKFTSYDDAIKYLEKEKAESSV